MSVEDFYAPSWTPAGPGTYARFMQIRVFDCWMHEQDIRTAVGRPGNETGPAAERSLDEVVGALGYIIGKLGRAPDGSSVLIRLTGPIERDLHVIVEGRARVTDALDGEPTAMITLSSSLFLRLAGGREDPETSAEPVRLDNDLDLCPSAGVQSSVHDLAARWPLPCRGAASRALVGPDWWPGW